MCSRLFLSNQIRPVWLNRPITTKYLYNYQFNSLYSAQCKVRELEKFVKLIRTPCTHHRPLLVWVGVVGGHTIQISDLGCLLSSTPAKRPNNGFKTIDTKLCTGLHNSQTLTPLISLVSSEKKAGRV